jgi:hypothetical protein
MHGGTGAVPGTAVGDVHGGGGVEVDVEGAGVVDPLDPLGDGVVSDGDGLGSEGDGSDLEGDGSDSVVAGLDCAVAWLEPAGAGTWDESGSVGGPQPARPS